MPTPPEPARDQDTIGSFKKTFNSAILTLVTRRALRPRARTTLLVGAAAAGAAGRQELHGLLVALGM